MDFSKIFGPNVSVREFFFDHVPTMYAERGDEFADYASESIIFSVFLQDTEERYSVAIEADSVEIEADEMVDFPLVTLVGFNKYWPQVREQCARLAGTVDARRHDYLGRFHLTQAFLDDFERFDVAVQVEIYDGDDRVEMTFVFNNYDDHPDFRRFGVRIPLTMVEAVASGDMSVVKAARSLKVKGDVALAVELGGLFLTHIDD